MEGFTATLDILVQREEQAYNFYTALAKMVDTEAMRQTLIGFAEEELKHKEKLIGMKGRKEAPPVGKILDLKISDEIDTCHPALLNGLGYLYQAGYLTYDRMMEILG
mgnify:CR=1 FL=1